MKTVLLAFLAFAVSIQASSPKRKRGSFDELNFDLSGGPTSWSSGGGIDKFLPLQPLNQVDYNLKVNLAPHQPQISSNTIGSPKPVQEPQDFLPPQSSGTAIIPRTPPPATPVNAVAANIPANGGAVFLGSGSLGVVNLGNGAYALGSGSIGYSEMRSNPRPTGTSPLFPPVPASPNLIPAAVPTSAPTLPILPLASNDLDYNHPFLNPANSQGPPIIDANGYEFLRPNRIGFGTPIPRLPRLRTTQQFATPTALQLQPQPQPQLQYPQLPTGSYEYTIGQTGPSYG